MFPTVDTRDAGAVQEEIHSLYKSMFPNGDETFLPKAFGWVIDSFRGRYANYLPIDARYHDLEHTLQGALCFARLLEGYFRAHADPPLSEKMVQLGLLAILLHDTGYLKTRDDVEGTGAKYTLVHVNRSCEFAARLLNEKGFSEKEIRAVQNMIRCTGVNVDLAKIPFGSQEERILGYALGTSDLLGQMAADDYIDKLGILFSEFEESAKFNSGKTSNAGAFATVDDLRNNTPVFWERYVLPKIKGDFLGLYRYLGPPSQEDNDYLARIRSNLDRLRRELHATPA
jgi:hypothetical protein